MRKQGRRLAACSLPAILCASLNAAAGPFALHTAAKTGDVAAARTLLESGVPVNVENDRGITPLHYAVVPSPRYTDHSLRMTSLLLQFGADPNYTPLRTGVTPLDAAVMAGSPGVVQLLLENGGNPEKIFPNGLKLLTMARSAGRNDVAAILEDFGATHGVSEFDRGMVENLPKAKRFREGLRSLRNQLGPGREGEYWNLAGRLAHAIWPELSRQEADAIIHRTIKLIDPSSDLEAAARDEVR